MPRSRSKKSSSSSSSSSGGSNDEGNGEAVVAAAADARALLKRLAAAEVPAQKDLQVVPKLREKSPKRTRKELTIAEAREIGSALKKFPKFKTIEAGLAANGWKKFPEKLLGVGGFGRVTLAYSLKESDKQIVQRKMSALKEQFIAKFPPRFSLKESQHLKTEIAVFLSLVHDNILDYYGHFMVPMRIVEAGRPPRGFSVMMLEYANAGDMRKEIYRFSKPGKKGIPEQHVIYYAKQIAEGLRYMHSRHISHNDLHGGNVLLKYQKDLSKVCMLGDFGLAKFVNKSPKTAEGRVHYRDDIYRMIGRVIEMLGKSASMDTDAPVVSEAANEFCTLALDLPATVDDLLRHRWFSGPTEPFIADRITPLVLPAGVADEPSPSSTPGPSFMSKVLRRKKKSPEARAAAAEERGQEVEPQAGPSHAVQRSASPKVGGQAEELKAKGAETREPPDSTVARARSGSKIRRRVTSWTHRMAAAGSAVNCFKGRRHRHRSSENQEKIEMREEPEEKRNEKNEENDGEDEEDEEEEEKDEKEKRRSTGQ